MTTVVVGTRDLRNALRAVAPLASTSTARGAERWRRIRIDIPASGPLIASATTTLSAGMALIAGWEDDTRAPATLDLSPKQVGSILEVFTLSQKKDEEAADGQSMVQIEVLDNAFELTDVSGLPGIDGRHFGEPRLEVDMKFTDVPHLLSRLHSSPPRPLPHFVASAKLIGDFRPAASAYGAYLRVTAREGWDHNYAVHMGVDFVGMLYAPTPSAGEQSEWTAADNNWADVLPDPASTPRDADTTKQEDPA